MRKGKRCEPGRSRGQEVPTESAKQELSDADLVSNEKRENKAENQKTYVNQVIYNVGETDEWTMKGAWNMKAKWSK